MSISEVRNIVSSAGGGDDAAAAAAAATNGAAGQDGQPPKEGGMIKTTTKEKLLAEIEKKLESSREMQERSTKLHADADQADSLGDLSRAQDLRHEARELDRSAASLLKVADRLQRGWIQGGAAGAGIGAGIAGGLGMTVGALVTGLTAIPTTGLGMLVGIGAGAVHGPWVKFTESFTGEDEKEIERKAEEELEGVLGGVS